MYKVLVVDDDKVLQDSVRQAIEYHHFMVDVADNGKEALDKVFKENYDLIVMDVNMPEMDGITALKEIKKYNPSIIVLILTAYSNVSDAVRVVKEGAYNYLEKPISSDNLVALIKRALKARTLVETTAFSCPVLSLGKESGDQFVGKSREMKKVFDVISRLSQVDTPVLIRGESGTGKELVARAIHYNGLRKDEKFITINLAAIPDGLIESELFGHEKGAFTGASERKVGKFQFADGGTIFLDEIGDISGQMQVKLLRILQEKTFTPVGSNRDVTVDVRVIAASHRPFEKLIKEDKFREDLFYRLNVLPVYLPPLRERKTDIPDLLQYYVDYFNRHHSLNMRRITEEALEMLVNHDWPGNIRELRNVVEHAFIVESTDEIQSSSLPEVIQKFSTSPLKSPDRTDAVIDLNEIQESIITPPPSPEIGEQYSFTFAKVDEDDAVKMDFQTAKEIFEKAFIEEALKVNRGKINQTALKANIPKKTLLRKIEKYEISPRAFY